MCFQVWEEGPMDTEGANFRMSGGDTATGAFSKEGALHQDREGLRPGLYWLPRCYNRAP